MSTNLVEISVEVQRETEKAYLCFDGKVQAWISKSQITDYSEEKGKITSIFIQEWLAFEVNFL